MTIKRGDIVALKRLLADLVGVVQSINEDKVEVRLLHSSSSEPFTVAKPTDLIKLSEAQEEEFPPDLVKAVERQRVEVFKPKREVKAVPSMFKEASVETVEAIYRILEEDN